MCIVVNDIILSANMTMYTFISTFTWTYFVIPLIFFVVSTITYVYWRVQSEEFGLINKVYYWIRWVVVLLINIPFITLMYRIFELIGDRAKTDYSVIAGNLSDSERLLISIISMNNIYFLIGMCTTACFYNLFNLFWCCQMYRILREGFKY